MKNSIYIYLLLTSFILLSGCSHSDVMEPIPKEGGLSRTITESAAVKSKYNISDFLPSKENIELSFSRGTENEIIREYIETLKEDKLQVKFISPSAIASSIYEVQDGALVLTYISQDNYIKKSLINEKPNSQEIMLMEPIIKGNTWENGDKTLTITDIDTAVKTPAGTFNSVEVTSNGVNFMQKDYYAVNLGKIKTIVETNGTSYTTELIDYKENKSLYGVYRYYYGSSSGEELYFVEESLPELNEKELMDKILYSLYTPPKEGLVALDKSIKMKLTSFSPENDYVHIDFSSDDEGRKSIGSSSEEVLINSIVNTLGFNYGVENILITFEGKNYSSDKLQFIGDGFLKVNYNNYIILK